MSLSTVHDRGLRPPALRFLAPFLLLCCLLLSVALPAHGEGDVGSGIGASPGRSSQEGESPPEPQAPDGKGDAAQDDAAQAPTEEAGTEESGAGQDRPRVVLILTGGLRWDQLDQTIAPELTNLGSKGAMANLVPISTRGAPCPVDTWLAMSAGQQISPDAVAATPTCGQTLVFPGAPLPDWERYQAAAASTNKRLMLGRFPNLLSEAGVSTHGIGNGAAYVLADESGRAPANFTPSPGTNEELADLVARSAASHDLTVVDADAESYASDEERQAARYQLQQQLADDAHQNPAGGEATEDRQTGAAGADELPPDTVDGSDAHPDRRIFSVINTRRVEHIIEKIPDGTRVVMVSAVDIDTYSYMQQFVAADVGDVGGARTQPIPVSLAKSDSVRQRGVIQTIDIVPTILGWFGAERDGVTGGTIAFDQAGESCGSAQACYASRADTLADQALHSGKMRTLRGHFIRTMTTGAIVYFLGSLLVLSRWFQRRSHPRLSKAWAWLGLTLASVPLASLIVNMFPWWTASDATLALFAGSWGLAAVLGLLAMVIERFVRAGALLTITTSTAILIAVDAAMGSTAMADSPVGFNLLTAARFYGVGNEAYALLATGVLLALAFLGERLRGDGGRRRTAWAVAAIAVPGFAVAAVDALPSMGADFGGVLSFLPALFLLMLLVARVRLSWLRIVSIGGITALVAAGIAFADWLRPEGSRTHLGRFVQSILDGEILDVLGRKLATNWRLLLNSTHRWVVLAALVLLALALVALLRESRGGKAEEAGRSGVRAAGSQVAGSRAASSQARGLAGATEAGNAGGAVGVARANGTAGAGGTESNTGAARGAEEESFIAWLRRHIAGLRRRAAWRRLASRDLWLETLAYTWQAIVHWREIA
ncbi:MAG: hypothetical protein Q3979_08095, partial [Actinomycetaceae bacterium]|nr:hypothetical protein [Actinomycetaceae bacterium]